MFCQSVFISCTRGGFLHLVPLVITVVVARQRRAFGRVVHLTFGSFFFFGVRTPARFLKLSVQFELFYLLKLLFPDVTAWPIRRTSSLFLGGIGNGGSMRLKCCYISVLPVP